MGTKNNPFGQAYCFREASSVFGDIPYLIYPLYDDINRLRSIERGASLDEGTSEQSKDEAKRFMQLANYTDALEFCYDSLSPCWRSQVRSKSKSSLRRKT